MAITKILNKNSGVGGFFVVVIIIVAVDLADCA